MRVQIANDEPGLASYFKKLNEQWLERYRNIGFMGTDLGDALYQRSDIRMSLFLGEG